MISIEQIRAGRALINWSQRQLAGASEISVRTLAGIELGQSVPRLETLKSIKAALEAQQVVFGDGHGVKLSGERMEIHKYEGVSCQEIILGDIISQLRWHGGEVCTNGVNETRYGELKNPVMDNFYRDCFKYKIGERILVEKGLTEVVAPSAHYRAVSKDVLGNMSYSVYHDSVGILTWEPVMRLVILRNATIAAHFQGQFDTVWDSATPLPFAARLRKDENLSTPWTMTRVQASRKKIKKMGY